jgi:hypothetical protein
VVTPSRSTRVCPVCHATLRSEAVICKTCKSLFPPPRPHLSGTCPACAEPIPEGAAECPHCGVVYAAWGADPSDVYLPEGGYLDCPDPQGTPPTRLKPGERARSTKTPYRKAFECEERIVNGEKVPVWHTIWFPLAPGSAMLIQVRRCWRWCRISQVGSGQRQLSWVVYRIPPGFGVALPFPFPLSTIPTATP